MNLPGIRQDIELVESARDEKGRPTWLLYDSSRNAFFRIREKTLHILAQWKEGVNAEELLEELDSSGTSAEIDEISEISEFLVQNNLTQKGGPFDLQRLLEISKAKKLSPLKWLATRYLFFRIPIFRPDEFLERSLFLVRPFLSSRVTYFCMALGIFGLYFASRQWDQFCASLLHFFSWDGVIGFAVTLGVLKLFHESGHAYTAKSLGCRVPSMGVAFLVLYPFLYTDTTDSWRLISPRDRFKISIAGIRAELCLAMTATFLWSFLPDGRLRSAMFFIATAGWVSSLAVNLSPFMRFDGYYILGDLMGEENLQTRAFSLGRHRIREALFGYGDPVPETVPPARYRLLLVYAWATWIYRFFLFLGIAILVYHLFFKLLGILLFLVEIWWFIMRPVVSEVGRWWVFRKKARFSRVCLVGCFMAGLAFTVFVPWKGHMVVPAVYETAFKYEVFSPEEGRIETVAVDDGQSVRKGDLLVLVVSPALHQEVTLCDIRTELLRTRMDRQLGLERDLKQIEVIQGQLAAELTSRKGFVERTERLSVRSPMDGVVHMEYGVEKGQWVSGRTLIMTLVGRRRNKVTVYVPETAVWRVNSDGGGRFVSDDSNSEPARLKVLSIGSTAESILYDFFLASVYGGPIAVRGTGSGNFRPEKGWYRMELEVLEEAGDTAWPRKGTVRLEASPTSYASEFWSFAVGVLIRESGF